MRLVDRFPLALIALAAAVLALACGGGGDDNATPTATATPLVATATATPTATRTATPTPSATPTATPTATASPTSTPAPEKPRVLWMLRDHGGTNLAVVRFATNVETTAVLGVFGSPGEPTGIDPQPDGTLAKEHAISIPLGLNGTPLGISLTVTDKNGQKAGAILEYGNTIVGLQYFGRTPTSMPKFTFTAPYRGTATWDALSGTTALPLGSIQVFGKQPACTTAQQCQATLKATATEDTRTLHEGYESHSIPVTLPDTPAQDFQLLYTVIIDNGQQPVSIFYQLDIPATRAAAGTN
ncbi:MAG: hypothetical protein K1X87_09515 [Dehalococcoidia bacterium]|nr:hypothetical protein [Dehalococcoidia bacterium]